MRIIATSLTILNAMTTSVMSKLNCKEHVSGTRSLKQYWSLLFSTKPSVSMQSSLVHCACGCAWVGILETSAKTSALVATGMFQLASDCINQKAHSFRPLQGVSTHARIQPASWTDQLRTCYCPVTKASDRRPFPTKTAHFKRITRNGADFDSLIGLQGNGLHGVDFGIEH
jgi:hypothetical protein